MRCGHEATDVRDIGLGKAPDRAIADFAKARALTLLTQDGDFGDIRNYPPADYAGIIILDLPDDWLAHQILTIIESILTQGDLLLRVPGRLLIVSPGRVRLRPP